MKYRLTVFVLLAAASSIFILTDISHSANTSGYVTIHNPYTRVPDVYKTSYSFGASLYYESQAGYIPYMRVFLPPGSISFVVQINDSGKRESLSLHHTPPATAVVPVNSPTPTEPYNLTQLEKSDCHSVPTNEYLLNIARDYFSPALELSRSGWLYVHVGDGSPSAVYYIKFHVEVDPAIYNDWWDHGGSNPDGSINWDADVESVVDYGGKPSPAKPTINKESGTDFGLDGGTITVTSSNASQIYYTMTSSNSGELPADPVDPLTVGNSSAKAIDATGTVTIPASTAKTIYKYKFQGKNQHGNGPVSDVYIYNNSFSQKELQELPTNKADITTYITSPSPDGLKFTDPNVKFLKPDSGAKLSFYSVKDLFTEYLTSILPTTTVTDLSSDAGKLLMIQIPELSSQSVIPIIIQSLIGTDASDTASLPDNYSLAMIYKNVFISSGSAGYNENQVSAFYKTAGWKVSFDSKHQLVLENPNDSTNKKTFRFSLVAEQPTTLKSDTICTITDNGDKTSTITYGDGTTQMMYEQ